MSKRTVTLNNGKEMPIVGLGTYNSRIPNQVVYAVKYAIDAGYRHIDTAMFYETENEVGEAIKEKIAEGVVTRKDMFVITKLWNTLHDPKHVRGALEVQLKALQLDYVDLYLIHWPYGYQHGGDFYPKNEAGEHIYSYHDLVDTWRAMEELVDAGLAKSIGISNFNIPQVELITKNARIQPVTNQIELHPYLLNEKLRKFCNSKNIVITAYAPLGSPGSEGVFTSGDVSDYRVLLKQPKLLEIAEKYNKSPGQVLIRFQVQLGNVVIPKSVTKERIISNVTVFDFNLTDEEMTELQSFGVNQRIFAFPEDKNHPEYPFNED